MQIKFDPAKEVENRIKHGVSLVLAVELDWEAALVWVDDRFRYDEVRMIALAPKSQVLYYVARGSWRSAQDHQFACHPSRGEKLCPQFPSVVVPRW